MRFKEIVRDIKRLDVYTSEQLAEYLNYFRQKDELLKHIQLPEPTENNIECRIKSEIGATPIKPNYSISEKVTLSDLNGIKKEQYTIGIVSGCFDLLHLGHIRGMAYAKQFLNQSATQYQPPLLVVLTLSDENIKAKKGESRPILNLNERLEMISNVECVDYVIPLEQPNCLEVLEKIKPKYFFKTNADRSQDIVRQEMELVESYWGKIAVFPPRPNSGIKSTTKIIESVTEKLMREW